MEKAASTSDHIVNGHDYNQYTPEKREEFLREELRALQDLVDSNLNGESDQQIWELAEELKNLIVLVEQDRDVSGEGSAEAEKVNKIMSAISDSYKETYDDDTGTFRVDWNNKKDSEHAPESNAPQRRIITDFL